MTTAVLTHAADPAVEPLPRGTMKMAGVLALGPVLALLDTTIVAVGIDSIAHSLGSTMSSIQWISTAYLLAIAMVMPLSSWASARFGAKRMWMISVALFVGGSALCGLAWSTSSLIAFRVLQGIGGGMIQPIGQSVMVKSVGPSRLARVMSMIVLPMTFAPAVGPALGGLILHDIGWRWMFLLNVPVGLVTLFLAARWVPADTERAPQRNRLDLLGVALMAPGLAGVLYGLTAVTGTHATTFDWIALCGGVALLIGYGVHALHMRGTALIDLRLFANRGFAIASGNSFLQGAVLYSSMLLLPLYFQQIQHHDPMSTGLLVLPSAIATAVAGFLAGKVAHHFSARSMILTGMAVTLLGTVVFTQLGNDPAAWLIYLSLLARGIGTGIVMVPGMAVLYQGIDRSQVGQASGTVNVLNRIGGALGTTFITLLLQHNLIGHPGGAAFGLTFWWVLGLSALSIAPAMLYPGKKN